MRITCVVDNNTGSPDPARAVHKARGSLLSEHGLSLLIETDAGRKVLLDTGSTERAFANNLQCLGLKPSDMDAVFISHGHYDHLGALPLLIREGVTCHTHPLTFKGDRYHSSSGHLRFIGASKELLRMLEDHPPICSSQPHELVPGVRTTGEVLRSTSFEVPEHFVIERDGKASPDLIMEEQGLCVSTAQGTAVLTGCGHAGIVNIVSQVRSQGDEAIRMVMGGFHLMGSSPEVLQRTVEGLHRLGVENVAPMHCTGFPATKLFADSFPGFVYFGTGCYIDL